MDRFMSAANEVTDQNNAVPSQSSGLAGIFSTLYETSIDSDCCHDCRRQHLYERECKCDCHDESFYNFGQKPISPETLMFNNGCGVFPSPTTDDGEFIGRFEKLTIAHPPLPCLLSPENRTRFLTDPRQPSWLDQFTIPLDQLLLSSQETTPRQQTNPVPGTDTEESAASQRRRRLRSRRSRRVYELINDLHQSGL